MTSEIVAGRRASAIAALQQGRYDDALRDAEDVLQHEPRDYDALQIATMAALYGNTGRTPLPFARQLAEAYPDDFAAQNSLGAALQVAGQLAEAAGAYQRAAALNEPYFDAWLNLGMCRLQLGELAAAVAALEKAARLQPRNATAVANLAVARALERLASNDATGALGPAEEVVKIAPQSADVASIAATAELESGRSFEAALAHLDRAIKLEANAPRWKFQRALAWPPMLSSRAQAQARMEEVHAELDALIASPAPLRDPFSEVGRTPFYFAYSGLDDTALQRKVARAYLAACPALGFRAPHVDRPPPGFRRIRLGILSAHLNNHTIGKLNIGLVQNFDRRRFELVVIRPARAPDELSAAFDEAADGVVELPLNMEAARARVAALELDALFYPEIGMDALTYFLAYSRLARLQFTTWGHPVTTGIPNVDAFLSTPQAETPDSARHYHERLVQLQSLPSYYHPPRPPTHADMRERLGIDRAARIYCCPQTLFKFHPDQDAALCEILRRDRQGILVLVAARQPAWNETLRRRFAAAGPDVVDRVRFIEPLSLPDFLALLQQSDALLDTFWFGGGNSSYEAFGVGRPVVTLPAPMMRGRVTRAWYAAMGDMSWVASSPGDYVEKALRMANDAAAQAEARGRIAANAMKLIGNVQVARDYEAFILEAMREAPRAAGT